MLDEKKRCISEDSDSAINTSNEKGKSDPYSIRYSLTECRRQLPHREARYAVPLNAYKVDIQLTEEKKQQSNKFGNSPVKNILIDGKSDIKNVKSVHKRSIGEISDPQILCEARSNGRSRANIRARMEEQSLELEESEYLLRNR
jgi:hypothetical protein